PGKRPLAVSNPLAQSAVPLPPANCDGPVEASALALVAAAPPGNSAARLPEADTAANEPAAAPVFSMHTCTATSIDSDTSTPVSVPNPLSNASSVSAPGLSSVTVALAVSETVAADPTPDGATMTPTMIEAAATTRRLRRHPFCATPPITPSSPLWLSTQWTDVTTNTARSYLFLSTSRQPVNVVQWRSLPCAG